MADTPDGTLRPAEPTKRIETIDVVRGFALLGIFTMNISIFAAHFAAYSNPTTVFASTPFRASSQGGKLSRNW